MRLYEIAILLGIPSVALLLFVWTETAYRRIRQSLLDDLAELMKDGSSDAGRHPGDGR